MAIWIKDQVILQVIYAQRGCLLIFLSFPFFQPRLKASFRGKKTLYESSIYYTEKTLVGWEPEVRSWMDGNKNDEKFFYKEIKILLEKDRKIEFQL